MPCVQIAGHRPALAECARWRSPTVPAAVKSPSSALVPAARLPGSASWPFSGDLLHDAEPPPSSRRASSNPHSASRTLGAPPSAISSLGQLPTPAVGARGSVAVAGVRNPAQERTWAKLRPTPEDRGLVNLTQEIVMSTTTISPLRQRMIEDMTARKFGPASQRSHIESCERFAAYLKRSPARVATGMISGVVSPLDELRKLPKS